MSEFIQVGTTAMRDPLTGGFLPEVPLYIREEDAEKVQTPVFDPALMKSLLEKFKKYKEEERKAKRRKRTELQAEKEEEA